MSRDMGAAALAEARSWIGTPYRHQGGTKGVGCDCLGLVAGIWDALYGGGLPQEPGPYAPDWCETAAGDPLIEAARRWFGERRDGAEPGDLIIFRWRQGLAAKHLGILSAPDRFIHAYSGAGVTESALVPQWRRRICGVFSFPPA